MPPVAAAASNELFRAAAARVGTASAAAGGVDELVRALCILVHKCTAIASLDYLVIRPVSLEGLHLPELGTTRQREQLQHAGPHTQPLPRRRPDRILLRRAARCVAVGTAERP